jgi:hypothetical protein
MLRRPLELRPELVRRESKELRPALASSALVQEQRGEQRARGAQHQLARRMIDVAGDEIREGATRRSADQAHSPNAIIAIGVSPRRNERGIRRRARRARVGCRRKPLENAP